MKRALLVLALLLVGTLSVFAQVFDFTLVNKTGFTIYEVYCSPSEDEEWGEDVLGVDVLAHNASVDITFDADYEEILLYFGVDLYDLKVVFSNGREMIWDGLKLETFYELTLTIDRNGNGQASWK